ncbi:hypothetical protein [Methylorubrum populi]|uniref:hypothetical protein n=1 Tax=Methylorubrum populi TaxID=223967 RepID=UPI001264A33F|nr:hypothetical protein [Methylorubrum populi]
MIKRRAEQLDDCRELATRNPEIADAGLRGCERESGPVVPTSWQEIIEKIGQVFDRLRLAKRHHALALQLQALAPI